MLGTGRPSGTFSTTIYPLVILCNAKPGRAGYAPVSLFRHRWDRGAWARPNGEGRVAWRGEASLGLAFFGSFWGNAKKNKLHLRSINHSPSPYKPSYLHPSHYHPAQPTHHNRPITNPKPLKYAHTLYHLLSHTIKYRSAERPLAIAIQTRPQGKHTLLTASKLTVYWAKNRWMRLKFDKFEQLVGTLAARLKLTCRALISVTISKSMHLRRTLCHCIVRDQRFLPIRAKRWVLSC